jgi:hypothetical protein
MRTQGQVHKNTNTFRYQDRKQDILHEPKMN